MRPILNKKGDIPSMFFAIAVIGAIGIFLFFFNHMFNAFYDEFDDYFDQAGYNNTEVDDAIGTIQTTENGLWDYVFLAVALMYILFLALIGFSTRISAFFFWVYGLMAVIGLFIATALSNTWQEMATQPELAATVARFPITNALLGTYFPTFILAGIVIMMILLFGKFGGEQ